MPLNTAPALSSRLSPSPWGRPDVYWLVALMALGLGLRLFKIDAQPFWLDEVFTSKRVSLDFSDMLADSFANRHMPSYFAMLQLLSPFNPGQALLRAPSALFGAMSAAMIYAVTRQVSDRGAAAVAGLLMMLSPQQVVYGQEARSYTLEILMITISLWGLLRIARDPAGQCLSWRARDGIRGGWLAYTLGTTGALDVLGDSLPWLAASCLGLYVIDRGLQGAERGLFRRQWLRALGVITVLCLPFYVIIMVASHDSVVHSFDWIPGLSWRRFWVAASSVYLMRMAALVHFDLLPTAVPFFAPAVALLGGLGIWGVRRQVQGRILIIAFCLLPLLFLLVSTVRPMLIPRYILWSAAPFFVLAGLGTAALPRRSMPWVVTGVLALGAVNLAPLYHTETKPRWDLAAKILADHIKPGDTIYTADTNAPAMLKALQPKNNMPIETTALVTPNLAKAVARLKEGGRVWAIHGRSALGKRERLNTFKSRLAALGTPSEQIAMGDEITILLFQPAPASPASSDISLR